METDRSLSHSIDNAKKHYSSLFSLPTYKKSLLYIAGLCIIGTSLSTYALFHNLASLALGLSLFTVTILADLVTSRTVLKNDPIFILRRTSAVSLVGWLLWLGLMALGTGLGFVLNSPVLWVKLTLLGFAAVLTLRTLVITATSESAIWRQVLSVLLQPILCIAALLAFLAGIPEAAALPSLPFIILAPIISYAAVYLFLRSIDRLGKAAYGLPAMPLFKAFLLNWATALNAPLEKHLEDMGENADIDVSLLKFDSSKPKAAIIVPQVHPGPFKNIGSSLLPSMLKSRFEQEYGCDACTPLGLLGHELDLASQAQNQRIVNEVLASAKFTAPSGLASPFIRATDGYAIASCQIFGDTVFLSFSLAPKTTEDLPQELGRIVTEEAKRYGLKHAVVVNAHNCLDVVVDTDEHLGELKQAASKCLQQATQLPAKPFMVGASTVFPQEFTLKQGMGTGGITAIVVEVEKQRTAYIVIDGNNMVPHLREKILASLASLGFAESEVFTTDTHAVSALSTGSQGYHPVGEVMDHNLLIGYIGEAAKEAAANLEAAKAGCIQFTVPQVRVIGEDRLHSVTALVDKAIEKAKKTAPLIFGVEGLLFILLLLLPF
jgi:putative membrane protein